MTKKLKLKNYYCEDCGGETHYLVVIKGETYWYCAHCGLLTEIEILDN